MLRATVLLTAVFCLGADKPAKDPAKHVGSWSREASGAKILFTFKADNTATMKVISGDVTIDVKAAYGVTPDGVLFGVITSAESRGTDKGPEKGDLFGFSFTASKGEMTVSDLRGTKVNDESRKLIEGVYSRK